MPRGIVQFYLPDKGYGYIRQEDTKEEFHFVAKHLLTEVQDKDQVYFEISEDKRGLHAQNIRRIDQDKK